MAIDGVIIKGGCSIHGCHPMILKAVWVMRDMLEAIAGVRCVLTSAWSHTHGKGSFHHYGMAIDVRSKEIATTALKMDVLARVKEVLGPEYDVLLEDLGGDNEHYHIEWEGGRPVREKWLTYIFLGGPEPEW